MYLKFYDSDREKNAYVFNKGEKWKGKEQEKRTLIKIDATYFLFPLQVFFFFFLLRTVEQILVTIRGIGHPALTSLMPKNDTK